MESSPAMKNIAASSSTKQKRRKDPAGDAWLAVLDEPGVDISRLDSLRRVLLNPDVPNLRTLSCYCGSDVHLRDSWHVMTLDGRLVCYGCAVCHGCGRKARQSGRRLVCIDGMVLCYICVKYYGYKMYPKDDTKVVAMNKNPLSAQDQQEEEQDKQAARASNCEYYDYNVPRIGRCRYTPKDDLRRLLRARYYNSPVKQLPLDDNPNRVAPAYLAENFRQPAMLCPACNRIALGPASYVVPSMARVYHRQCFQCCNCKLNFTYGLHTAGITYYYCSCEVPQVWCARNDCCEARLRHHKLANCRLGCIRPGGRPQIDDLSQPVTTTVTTGPARTKTNRSSGTQPQSD